jgi:hypothetical protein
MEPRNRFRGIDSDSLYSLAGRYENPIPTWFLAPIECSKIPALEDRTIYRLAELILWNRFLGLQIQALVCEGQTCFISVSLAF